MNIETKSSSNLNNTANAKPVETAETAGSLAYQAEKSWFAKNSYDTFSPSNPFAQTIDFSNYTPYTDGETVATSNFMAGFASAVATVGTDCSGVSAGGCGSFSGASAGSSCSSGGGFSSFV
ncbi:unknown [Brachyspira sp. CAG:484]|nr:unknown [Brachyspira sp. CAG:484]